MSEFDNELLPKTVDQDAKNLALLTWVGTIFFGFIPGLIMYLVKKDEPFICSHAKEALNWSITVTIAYFACLVLTVIVIGALLLPVVGICHLVFCILGAIKASNGENYLCPFAIRLIK